MEKNVTELCELKKCCLDENGVVCDAKNIALESKRESMVNVSLSRDVFYIQRITPTPFSQGLY